MDRGNGMAQLDWIRIVLVEPAGPLNVGSVARVMKNFGLGPLVLVNPQCDPLGAEARQMAVHAADVLEQAQRVTSVAQALEGCTRSIATSGRDRLIPLPLGTPRQMLPWLWEGFTPAHPPAPAALIFGREDSGLTNAELHYAQRLIQIPSDETYTSLNLAQAVAVCCYELRCHALDGLGVVPVPLSPSPKPDNAPPIGPAAPGESPPSGPVPLLSSPSQGSSSLDATQISEDDRAEATEGLASAPAVAASFASLADLDRYYGQLEQLLLQIGYLYPHTAARRMQKFRRIYNRAQLSHPELAMLQGMIRQTQWAIEAGASLPTAPTAPTAPSSAKPPDSPDLPASPAAPDVLPDLRPDVLPDLRPDAPTPPAAPKPPTPPP